MMTCKICYKEYKNLGNHVNQKHGLSSKEYYDKSRPVYCAKKGFIDEVVRFEDMRRYMVAFAGAAYQNPRSICPQHHMMLPRLIRSQIVKGLERPQNENK